MKKLFLLVVFVFFLLPFAVRGNPVSSEANLIGVQDTCSTGWYVSGDAEAPAQMITITFQPNGGLGAMESQTVARGVSTPLNPNAFDRTDAPENDRNWIFIGWNTKADGTGTSYTDKANVIFNSDAILYAQWHTWCTGTPKTFVNEFGTSRIDSVKDVDYNVYTVVQIGSQCWMKENLRTTHYVNGTHILLGRKTSTETACRYYTNESENYVSTYGYLYNWKAVMDNFASSESNPSGVRGICPRGWHVPSDAEWTQLINYVSSQSQYLCGSDNTYIAKALTSTTGWVSYNSTCAVGNNPSSNNATGFSAVPAGTYYGSYSYFGNYALFWSSTQYNNYYVYDRDLFYSGNNVLRYLNDKVYGCSVRCLRNAEQE